ncbi:MAG: flavin-containing monooxygenase [Thermoleophilaceae bacterium]
MRVDTVIVGAGHAGLAVSRLLADAGHEHVVLERGCVGESWRSQRWDSFRLNTPHWMSRLPLDEGVHGDPDCFAHRDETVDWLERHAFGLPVRTGVTVEAVGAGHGSRYTVVTTSGVYGTENVVVASGAQNVPRVPEFASRLPDSLQQLHVADYRSPDRVASGPVLVVGGAQSGAQVAEELAAAGREVYLSTSRVGRITRRYRGRDMLAWWQDMGVWDHRPDDPGIERGSPPLVSGTRGGHTLSLQQLAREGVTILGRLTGVRGTRLVFADDADRNARHGNEIAARWRRRIDEHIARTRAHAAAPEPDPADEPGTLGRSEGPAEVAAVIWCTGFRGDFGYLRLPVLDADGNLVHRGGATAAPGLFAIGLPWLRARKSGIIWGAREDADAVAGAISASAARRAVRA